MAFYPRLSYMNAMEVSITSTEMERLTSATNHLRDILLAMMPEPGIFPTPLEGVGMARRDCAGFSEHRFDGPLVSLLVQGSKETIIGGEVHKLEAPQILTVCIDMPSSSRILAASPEKPLLTLYFYIDPAIIRELLLELDHVFAPPGSISGALVTNANAEFVEGMLLLAGMMSQKENCQLKAAAILRYLHILLLSGATGAKLGELYAGGGRNGRILFNSIRHLKENLDRVVSLRELARIANMSETTLYRNFKNLTGLTPLQYHKQLRLHKARELIMGENEQVALAAYRVGYASVSQFGREYKKMFGLPPKQSQK